MSIMRKLFMITRKKRLSAFFIAFLCVQMMTPLAFAAERDVKINTPFPNIVLDIGQYAEFKINLINNGQEEEVLDLSLSGPLDWEYSIKSGRYLVKSVYLDVNESKSVIFEAVPPSGEDSGLYTFMVYAESRDGKLSKSLTVQVELMATIAESGIRVSTPYPSIEGAAGQDFEFSVEVVNKDTKDMTIDFTALHPPNWQVTFKPRVSDNLIRSLEFKGGASEVLNMLISPPPGVAPGYYDIEMKAESDEYSSSLVFSIYLIGTYSLEFIPSNGRLSLDAQQGKASVISLNVNNTGTAPLKSVIFLSDQPVGWDVEFDTTEIPLLDRSGSRQVRARITPPTDAIPGDYIMKLYSSIQKEGISESINYRVTVKGDVSWGFVGIGIIVVLAVALVGIVWRLGRR